MSRRSLSGWDAAYEAARQRAAAIGTPDAAARAFAVVSADIAAARGDHQPFNWTDFLQRLDEAENRTDVTAISAGP